MDGNYVALGVTLVVWLGIFFFVFKLDKKVKKLEEKMQ